jgi:putative inorganic carbon (HCO3(-)) transporter
MGLGGMLAVILIAIISFGDHVLFSRSVSFCFWSLAGLWASCISHANEK